MSIPTDIFLLIDLLAELFFLKVRSSTYYKCRDEAADSPSRQKTAEYEHLSVPRLAGYWRLEACSSLASPSSARSRQPLVGVGVVSCPDLLRPHLHCYRQNCTHAALHNGIIFRSIYYLRGSHWHYLKRPVRPLVGPCTFPAPGTVRYSSL